MDFHEAATIFPLMTGESFNSLVVDIKANGLRVPIVTLDDKILDGRNRYFACEKAGVMPEYEEWKKGGDPISIVLSLNEKRRHLTPSQMGIVGARAANLRRGANQHEGKEDPSPDGSSPISQTDAAKMVGVHSSTVERAARVLREGTPEQISSVEKGEKTVNAVVNEIRGGAPARKPKTGVRHLADNRNFKKPYSRKTSGEKLASAVGSIEIASEYLASIANEEVENPAEIKKRLRIACANVARFVRSLKA